MFGGSMFDRGVQFLQAFAFLTENDDGKHVLASYYLLTHSLELLLKAHLASHGLEKKELKKLGHQLSKIFARCKDEGLPEVCDLDLLVDHLGEMNQNDDFRYPSGYSLTLPRADEAQRVLRDLVSTIEVPIKNAAVTAMLQFAADTRHLNGKKIRWSD